MGRLSLGSPRAPLTFPAFATALVLLGSLVAAALMPAQNDTWWQLRAGRDFWHHGIIATSDTWSSTAAGRFWPDHEWLWQVLAYPVHAVGGMPALAGVNAVLAVLAIVVVRSIVGPPSRIGLLVLFACIPVLSVEWSLRPQIASLLCFALTLRAVARERWTWLPVLFLVWANLHAGVSSGGVLLAAAFLWALVRTVLERDPVERARAWHRVRSLGIVTALCALATLVTPLGWRLWAYVWESRSNPTYRWISEWQSVFHVNIASVAFAGFLVAVALSVGLRRDRFSGWAAQACLVGVVVTVALVAVAVRNVSFFMLAALPTLTLAWQPDRARDRDHVPRGRVLLAVAAVVTAVLVGASWAAPTSRMAWHPISPTAVAAIDACPGPMFNTYDEGGYLLWFTPAKKVFVDSRLDPYPIGFLRRTLFVHGAKQDLALLREYDVDCAVLTPGDRRAEELARAGWHTTYRDAEWLVLQKPA